MKKSLNHKEVLICKVKNYFLKILINRIIVIVLLVFYGSGYLNAQTGITFSPSSLTFQGGEPGTTETKSITITNNTNSHIYVNIFSLPNPNISYLPTSQFVVQMNGGSKTISITLTYPECNKTYSIELNISSSIPPYLISNSYQIFAKPTLPYSIITGPLMVCSTNTTFTINNLPENANVSWTKSNNLIYVNGQSTGSYTVRSKGSGLGWVQAVVENECGNVDLPRHNLWVGTPNSPTSIMFYPQTPCTGQGVYATVYANNPPSANAIYEWQNTHNYIPQNPDVSEVYFQTLSGYWYTTYVKVSATNSCGTSWQYSQLLTVKECQGGGIIPVQYSTLNNSNMLQISPNPTNFYLTIEELEPKFDEEIWNIFIVNQEGVKQLSISKTLPHTFNVSRLKSGIYFLVAQKGEYTEQHNIIIK
jgi:hypothetical protein